MSEKFTERAIAYLKASVSGDDPQAVKLSHADSPVLRPLVDGLYVAYVVDDGSSYHYVQNRHLEQGGVSEEELHEIGLRNLLAVVGQRDLRVQPYQNIHAVLMGGDFEASLILLDQIWEHHFQQFVPGAYAVAIPARDILAFCDTTNAAGLAELGELIERIYTTGDHPVSSRIYVRHQSRWQPQVA